MARPVLVGLPILLGGLILWATGAAGEIALKHGDFGTPLIGLVYLVSTSCGAITVSRALLRDTVLLPSLARRVLRYSIPIICLQTVPLWWHPSALRGAPLLIACFVFPVVVGYALERLPARWAVRRILLPS